MQDRLFMTEDKLPLKIREKARVSTGGEYAWKKNDVEEVIDSAQELGLACIGGQPQFQLSDGTCELYWVNYDSTERNNDELWEDYVKRSAYEVKTEFYRKCIETDFEKEAKEFDFLKDKMKEKDFKSIDYLYFVLYFNSEYDMNKNHFENNSMEPSNTKKELKYKYKTMFSELTHIVNRNDPAGLIETDTPEDEYCCEVTDILAGLRKCNSLSDTSNLVASIFNEAFDSDFSSDKYLDLAEPIWNWWKNQSSQKKK